VLRKIKNKIKANRKVKYQKIIFSKKDIILRKKAVQLINRSRKDLVSKKEFCGSCNFYSRSLNQKNFIIFYKKFNFKLELKEKYCLSSYKKKSNRTACFKTYLLLSNFLKKNKEINNIQKLNTILKINDLLILMYSRNKHSNLVRGFMKNIEFEYHLMKKFL
jgi:hypothetical protein